MGDNSQSVGQPASEADPAYRYRRALQEIINTLGPAACRCEGQQAEVDEALDVARAALADA
jgi:hypothetical protein